MRGNTVRNGRRASAGLGLLGVLVACSAANGQTFTGTTNGNWNLPGNWSAMPGPGGGLNLSIVFGAVAAGSRTTNQNHSNPFNLNTLVYQANVGGAIIIGGSPLQFNNPGAAIVTSTDNVIHRIDSAINLNTDLEIRGPARNTNDNTGLWIAGAISEAGGARTLNVNLHSSAVLSLSASNAYSGGTNLTSGTIVISDTAALGTGPLNIIGSSTGLWAVGDITINNAVTIANNTSLGFELGSLTLGGTTAITASAANTTRTIGIDEVVFFSGVISTNENVAIVRFEGSAGPALDDTKKRFANPAQPGLGDLVTISGNNTAFRAGVEVRKSTLRLNGNLGAAATPIKGNVVVGDGTSTAGFIGTGKVFLDKTTFIQPGGRVGARFDVKKNAITKAGNSPGILTIDGGVTFHGGSILAVDIDGPPSLGGPAGASRLVIEDGDLDLLFEEGERPYLGVAVLAQNYIPQLGDSWVIVDILSSLVPRVDLPNLGNPYNTSPNLFSAPDGTTLLDNGIFIADGFTFRIDYDGGDGNDVTLTVMAIPAPGSLCGLAVAGLAALRRRR